MKAEQIVTRILCYLLTIIMKVLDGRYNDRADGRTR